MPLEGLPVTGGRSTTGLEVSETGETLGLLLRLLSCVPSFRDSDSGGETSCSWPFGLWGMCRRSGTKELCISGEGCEYTEETVSMSDIGLRQDVWGSCRELLQ